MTKKAMNFTIALAVLLLLVAGAWIIMGGTTNGVAAMSDDTVVAVVNDEQITRGDVKDAAAAIPQAAQVPIEQIYPMLVDQMINEALLEDRVDQSGIASDPEVEKRMAEMRKQIASTVFVERYIDENITEERLRAEYEDVKSKNADVKEVHARHIPVSYTHLTLPTKA